MTAFNFKIENTNFTFDSGFLKRNSFEILSIPRPYQVILDEATPIDFINKILKDNSKNLLLIDENVFNLYCQKLDIEQNRILKITATEENKTLNGVEKVIKFLNKNEFSKGETLIVAGGGITQDIGGLAGALYKRGINWILLPTTLLSMCDSCIGGKVGVNFKQVKNQLALFSAPRQVVIMPEFLKTLSAREIKSGLGEILKLCVTGGKELFDIFIANIGKAKQGNSKALKTLILAALGVKKQVIEADEFELNLRRALNYGHTLGHAMEVLSNYGIPHGQAVVMGIIIADKLSASRGVLKEENRLHIKNVARNLFDIKKLPGDITQKLPVLLKNDKKASGNTINFVIIKDLGNTQFLKLETNKNLMCEIFSIISEEFNAL